VVTLSRSGAGEAVACDLLDPDATRRAVRDAAPDVVFHLAALASVAQSWEQPGETLRQNPAMTLHVLEAVRQERPEARVVAVASGELYGPPESLPVDERALLRPQNPYAVSKAAADLLAGLYHEAHGLHVVRARAFNHAGPGQQRIYVVSSLSRQLAEAAVAGRSPVRIVTGNPDARRDFTDVRDVVRAYRSLAAAAPGVYNVCSGRSAGVREILALLRDLGNGEIEHVVEERLVRAHEVMDVRGSHARLSAETGWEPEIPFEQTVADTFAWWREELGGRV